MRQPYVLSRKDWRDFHLRCSGLQATRHCFDGLQRIPEIPGVQQMKSASPGSCQISSKRCSFVNLRTPGAANANHKDSLRAPGYVIDTRESLGDAFKKMREARNMLQQRAVTPWENRTGAATDDKLQEHGIVLPGDQKNTALIRAKREIHFMIFVSIKNPWAGFTSISEKFGKIVREEEAIQKNCLNSADLNE